MNKVTACLIAVVLVICGIFLMTIDWVDTSEEPKNLSEISYQDLEGKHIYYGENLAVLDCFASLEDEDVLYISVLFEDKDGKFAVLNMPVNESDEIWDDVNDYISDSSMSYYETGDSDLTISGYVRAEEDVNVQGVLRDYFDEWVEAFQKDVSISVETTDLRFNFICGEDGDPYAIAKGTSTAGLIGGIVLIALALVILYFGALRKRKPAASYFVPAPDAMAAPVAEQLKQYQALVESGVMTSEEYEQKRRELLEQ